MAADAQGVEFQDASGATVLTYAGLRVWDADGKVLRSRFEMADGRAGSPLAAANGEEDSSAVGRRAGDCAPYLRLVIDERGARYPLTIDPIAQQAYLKAHQVNEYDQFGISVAVSGDTVVVGANGEASSTTGINSTPNESASNAGAAYVFTGLGPPLFISQISSVNPFQFQFDGGGRPAFEVEASTNLTNWLSIGQATNLSGSLFQFADPSSTNFPSRFFRLKVP